MTIKKNKSISFIGCSMMLYFLCSIFIGCNNRSSDSNKVDFHGFPEDEIKQCIYIQMIGNHMQLVRIVSVEETPNDYSVWYTADVYLDVIKKDDFRARPETIRVKMPLIFDKYGSIIGSSIEEI